MTALVRFLAGALLLAAVVFAVNDGTRSHAAGRASFASVYDIWSALSPATVKAAQGGVQRYTHPVVWDWGIVKVLQMPAWALLGFLGLVLAYAGRRRRRVNIYAN
jgi:hypothetical protein